MSAPLVLKFSHLAKMTHPDKALTLLEKIASLVKPIMKKHSWTLPLLAEFFPSNPGLLGMNYNSGQKILIRLRPAHAPDTFLELEDLVGTMLHELTHNVHGPHDAKFYAFMKVLNDEYDQLMAKGYSGEGFLSNGSRVGQGVAHDLPPHLAKAKALAAAEERAKKQRSMGPGGKIGGVRKVGKAPRELAADAAERRMRDDKTCGSAGRKEMEEEEMRKAARDGIEDVASQQDQPVDIDLDTPPDASPSTSAVSTPSAPPLPNPKAVPPRAPAIASASSSASTSSLPNPLKRSAPPPATSSPSSSSLSPATPVPAPKPASRPTPPKRIPRNPTDQWPCPTCTFLNASILPSCEICETSRPPEPEPEGTWACEKCGAKGMEDGFWSCRVCGGIKSRS